MRVAPPSKTALPCSTTSGVDGGRAAHAVSPLLSSGKLPKTYSRVSSSAKQTKGALLSVLLAVAELAVARGQLAVLPSPPQRSQVVEEADVNFPLPSPLNPFLELDL